VTVAEHCDVCAVVMLDGLAVTETEVTVTGTVTAMGAEPETFVYPACVELAIQLAVPAPERREDPCRSDCSAVAVHVTAEL